MNTTKQNAVLTAKDLTLQRSKSFALKITSLTIKTNGICCLLGANGSGKTSLLETIVGILSIDRGNVHISGSKLTLDNVAAKKNIGYIPDDDNWIIAELTAREYFVLHQTIYKEAGVVADTVNNTQTLAKQLLFNSFDQTLGSLSHGNKRKVQLIAGLMHEPPFVVIDELRNGLDPIAIKRAEDLLKANGKNGTTILCSTHDLWWAQRFADEIIMIKDGRILLQQPTKKIVAACGSVENKFMELYA